MEMWVNIRLHDIIVNLYPYLIFFFFNFIIVAEVFDTIYHKFALKFGVHAIYQRCVNFQTAAASELLFLVADSDVEWRGE